MEFTEIVLRKYGLDHKGIGRGGHPQEDYLLASKKYPIFAIADGVTLTQYLVEKKSYPNPSPAGEVARTFCETLVASAEARYESFQDTDTGNIFRAANGAVGDYNQDRGRTEETVDYWGTDFYAATAAFAILKGNVVHWGSICDSYVACFNRNATLRFRSPAWDSRAEMEEPAFRGDAHDERSRTQFRWREVRNGVNAAGQLVGYGVATGEEAANRYLNAGSFPVEHGDIVAIFTDGFEEYFELPEFTSLFGDWPDDLEARFQKFTAAKATEDPEKFGHERSLIAISI